ncbi:MAG: glycerophosphodiester phosphodiesterase [Zetaproteobacteria bacterium CG12_big_fil_rev_8_21_14_0_65_54_13]|nr:MAG: glycerophosphodiester phosphodiesterase [Zetaproteobacteria bacterium CG12_big_fil_rev_8_21_14_0_65_54_13]PIX53421.1 MAG: glycerophosphodiester phosphodiesterase [Zetaproteobacteria bacterium CG_4_10_14_3_um_filter_54_28]PJA30982.1 MAG: glycerophosphodiester phosphodiesterase [Zetaproteobacteria bacterium CG_4_9_14_3_um_filter_54_145]
MIQPDKTPFAYLVAHRGDRDGGVENTLAAFKQAAAAGARFAECDIQLTRDLVPVVLHDNWLKRLCARPDIKVMQTDLVELQAICQPHFDLLTLAELLLWLQQQPQLTMFIEIKPAMRRRLSAVGIIKLLAASIPTAQFEQLVLISQSAEIIDACKKRLPCRTGWVAESARQPESAIDYLFMPSKRSSEIAAWHEKSVKVGLYTVNSPDLATELMGQHADLVETDNFTRMAAALA